MDTRRKFIDMLARIEPVKGKLLKEGSTYDVELRSQSNKQGFWVNNREVGNFNIELAKSSITFTGNAFTIKALGVVITGVMVSTGSSNFQQIIDQIQRALPLSQITVFYDIKTKSFILKGSKETYTDENWHDQIYQDMGADEFKSILDRIRQDTSKEVIIDKPYNNDIAYILLSQT